MPRPRGPVPRPSQPCGAPVQRGFAERPGEDWDLTWNIAVETSGLLVGKKVEIVLDVEAVKES